ncbi:MAG: hypothetical protein IK016_10440 [Lachnospiraceae bacterium]|nr:hypothetical protein [Lachnospiraceae bacterium]
MNATDVRKEWSSVIDDVVRERPAFIKRTRDKMFLSDVDTMLVLLGQYHYSARRFREDDGSITLSLNEMDLVENAATEAEAKHALAEAILEYANEYYENYALYSASPNRREHIPYVLKALITEDLSVLEDSIVCRSGKN